MAARLTPAISHVRGVEVIPTPDRGKHGFWKYAMLVSEELGGPDALASALRMGGVASAPRYIQKPAFECAVIRDQQTFGGSRFPFTLARAEAVDYAPANYPGVYDFLKQVLVLPWNERLQEVHIDHIAQQIAEFSDVFHEGVLGMRDRMRLGIVGAGAIARAYAAAIEPGRRPALSPSRMSTVALPRRWRKR